MRKKQRPVNLPDIQLMLILVTLVLIGISFCYSASSALAERYTGDHFYFLKQHLLALFIGVFFLAAGLRLDIEHIHKAYKAGIALSLILLFLVFMPFLGRQVQGANRWVLLGFIRFQPSEICKIFLLIYLANILTYKEDRITQFLKGTLPPMIITSLIVLLIAVEPDLSSAILYIIVAFSLFFLSGAPLLHLFTVLTVSIPFFLALAASRPYIINRFIFFDPFADPFGKGYHLIQSIKSFSLGGLTGVGLGNSVQKIQRLPDAHTDFVFAIIGEELGLLGCLFIISLFILLAVKGFQLAARQLDRRNYLLIMGITILIVTEAVIHIFVNTGMMPTTGLPLPFISYGRTALLVNMFLSGVLLNLSRQEYMR